MSPAAARQAARIAIVGIHGHGRWHLREVRRLAASGVVELAGVCDPRPPAGAVAELVGGVPWTTDVDELLAATAPDIVVVVTPIHTHADIALRVAAAGAHLLLEKPPAPSLAEFDRMADGIGDAGVACQVGFQHLASGVIDELVDAIAAGALGELRGVGASGVAVRDAAYFARGTWAGRRRLDGVDVVDGALTNPYLHAVAAALRITGADEPAALAGIELELHRANAIEADDTSVARLVTTSGVTVVVAATLCASSEDEPVITVHGTGGTATWRYRRDAVDIDPVDGTWRTLECECPSLLANLVDHVHDRDVPLLVPLARMRAITSFVDAVRRAPDPVPIPPEYCSAVGEGEGAHVVVSGADRAVRRAAAELAMFTEQGVPWAVAAGGEREATLAAGGRAVASYQVTPSVAATLSPRPYLHPVCTIGGTVVSDASPADHRWHLGVGIAVQDVAIDGRTGSDRAGCDGVGDDGAGVNFWGGRTYVRDRGYLSRDDHGTIRHLGWTERRPGRLAHELAWIAPDHRCLLAERRTIAAEEVPGATDRFALTVRSTLHNVSGRPLRLGSPGSNGREGGGYGGFFWRLPEVTGTVTIRTERASGEEAVHGTVAPWLEWIHDDAGGGAFTLVAAPGDALTADDPWFVRLADYPGFGSALAWDRPVLLAPGATTTRSVVTLVADGADHDPAALAAELQSVRSRGDR